MFVLIIVGCYVVLLCVLLVCFVDLFGFSVGPLCLLVRIYWRVVWDACFVWSFLGFVDMLLGVLCLSYFVEFSVFGVLW